MMSLVLSCRKVRLLLALLACTLIPLLPGSYGAIGLRAQDLQFEHFTQADGLPAEGPYWSIVQDRQGFLWLGTDAGGLIRYDGFQFDTFRHNPEDSTSLSDNAVQILHVDLDGVLWVGMIAGGGLNRYDAATETFSHYLQNESVRAILQTRDSTLR